jgi:hypothetical protein
MEFWRQKLQSFVLALRLFGAKILYEKRPRKTLMILQAAGVNFINILRVIFCQYPLVKKSQSRTVNR